MMMSEMKRIGPARPPSARNLNGSLPSRGFRQPRRLGQAWVHVIPWLSTHREDVLAGAEFTRIVQAARSNRHHVRPGTRFAEERRPALSAEDPASHVAAVRLHVEVLRTPLRQSERCSGYGEDGRKGTPGLSLTIPTMTVQREEWLRPTFVPNSAAGAATGERRRHCDPPSIARSPHQNRF